jgi:hypothetical protein
MAINPSDIQWAIIKETAAGTTPASPTFLTVPYIPGDQLNYSADMVSSNVLQASRASDGARKAGFKVEGGIKTHFRRANFMDLLLESALSGAFATNVLKAGATDTSISFEKKWLDGATPYYHRFTGCQVADMNLTCDASGNAEISFGVIGMGRSTATTAIASSTYTGPGAGTNLMGMDVGSFTVAGLTATFRSLELSVSHNREAQDQFGSAAARAVGTSGFRTVTLKATFYRNDLSADTLLATSDTPVAVSFSIGSTGTGYTFTLPAANYTVPMDADDASKALIEVTFTAKYDTTAATDFSITKL